MPTPAQAEQRFEPAHWQPHPQPRAASRTTAATGTAAGIGAAGLAAGRRRRALAAAGNDGQQLGQRRFARYARGDALGPASALPAFQPRGVGRRPTCRARVVGAATATPAGGRARAIPRSTATTPSGTSSSTNEPGAVPPPRPAAATAPPPAPHSGQAPHDAAPPPPQLAPAPHPEPAPRHLGADPVSDGRGQPGGRPANRRSVGCRLAGAAAGAAIRRWPASSPRRLSWDLPHIGAASPID